MRLSYLFPGQGSQYVGMGKELYETYGDSRLIFQKADEVLGFRLSELCFSGPLEELTKTYNCQPAVFVASLASLAALRQEAKERGINPGDSGAFLLKPQYAAGLSLGEYTALVASSSIGFVEGLRLVRLRAQWMQEEAEKSLSGMSAIIGLGSQPLEGLCRACGVDIANLNSPDQIVVAGPLEGLKRLEGEALKAGAKRAVRLAVSGAFHSRLMRPVATRLRQELEKVAISPSQTPIVSNFTGQEESEPGAIRENLLQQVFSSVRWQESMEYMINKGVRRFLEIGPANVLKGLARKINPQAEVWSVGSPEDIKKLWG